MSADTAPDVTRLLLAWREGDFGALDRLAPLVYGELRKPAHARMRAKDPHASLDTTGLVHEAYLRLAHARAVPLQNCTHFDAVRARLMRRILADRARARRADKRGGDDRAIALGDWQGAVPARDEEVLALHQALERLAQADARKAEVVQAVGGGRTGQAVKGRQPCRTTILRTC